MQDKSANSTVTLRPNLVDLDKIRVGAVSYLNTKPLLFGIKQHEVFRKIDLIEDYPASVAKMLMEDKVDVALIPVAVIPRLTQAFIISDYCIGAEGPVASVCLFSEVSMEQIKEVYLDYQSRTSVNLAKILLKEYWKKEVKLIDATGEDFRSKIKGTTAGVVIGDRALEQRLYSKYIYDLASAWQAHTGLPFVFATWVANKALPPDFVSAFNEANKQGLDQLPAVLAELQYDAYDLETYYTKNISYFLSSEKRSGMELFLKKLAAQW